MPSHKALLAKEIFDDSKWWIIVLGASPCKSVFCNHQRYLYLPLSNSSLETNVLLSYAQQRSDPVFAFTTLLGTKPLTHGKFTKDLKGLLKQLGLGTGYIVVCLIAMKDSLMGPIQMRTQVMSTFAKSLPTFY